ncbi:PqqD family protein [Nodosilinea sp. P-1105]|uniref:PqqD family protein n=1 Tax=Nodosilinea sp. P-1105 TaxID=2546229 RepID=UPI00146A129E|nr:PqqD family protein [Nodosilinea sp. P-1105]NMF83048.1 PqqD family protein [Nodosilinea sp. P-1105]
MPSQLDITSTTTLKATSNQVSSEVGEEVVILQLQSGQYFGLDGVGAVVWEKLQTPVTPTELEAGLINEFDVEPEVLRHDLQVLIQDLAAAGLVDVKGES